MFVIVPANTNIASVIVYQTVAKSKYRKPMKQENGGFKAETGEARSGLRLAPKDDAAAELQLRRNWIARGRMSTLGKW